MGTIVRVLEQKKAYDSACDANTKGIIDSSLKNISKEIKCSSDGQSGNFWIDYGWKEKIE